jgi:hypothetical protein
LAGGHAERLGKSVVFQLPSNVIPTSDAVEIHFGSGDEGMRSAPLSRPGTLVRAANVGHLAQGLEQCDTQRSARCPRNSDDESHQPTAPKWWTVGAVGVNRRQAGSVSGVPVRMKPSQAERI